jgi:tagatose-1,6-bisphosphate aldolase non-catalytic subunit AgaZ/GatZ
VFLKYLSIFCFFLTGFKKIRRQQQADSLIFMKSLPHVTTMPVLVDHVIGRRNRGLTAPVIIAFCFSDISALKACLSGCRMAQSIPVIMTTFNQVNSDGGYAGVTASGFVALVSELAAETGYAGPIIFGRDHGGPFTVYDHRTLTRQQAMTWVKYNITEDLKAGFSCWHADGTSGRDDEKENGNLPMDLVAAATIEMIAYCERERKRLQMEPISYEVGSEEQQGGLTEPDRFDTFLDLFFRGIISRGLTSARIDFVVAQTGTHMKLKRREGNHHFQLYQDGFKPHQVKELDRVARKYRHNMARLLFTQHYSDHITPGDADALLRSGAGKANFGPEMTMPELRRLLEWETKERERLCAHGRIHEASGFREAMINEMDKQPEIWQNHLPESTTGEPKAGGGCLSIKNPDIQDALIVFRGRYVKNRPACAAAIRRLLRNVMDFDIDRNPEKTIIDDIRDTAVIPRIRQFRMMGIQDAIIANG